MQAILPCDYRNNPPLFIPMLGVPMFHPLQIHPLWTDLYTLHECLITTISCSSKSLAPHFLEKNWYSLVALCNFFLIENFTIHTATDVKYFTNLEYKKHHITIILSHVFFIGSFLSFSWELLFETTKSLKD